MGKGPAKSRPFLVSAAGSDAPNESPEPEARERKVLHALTKGRSFGALIGLCALAFLLGPPMPAARAQGTVPAEAAAQLQKPVPRSKATKPAARKTVQRAGGRYYIEFRSRHALSYGHTFVMFGRLNARGEIATREVAGLHPKGDGPELWTIGHAVFVPAETGPSDGDLEDEYMSARYRIELNEAEYKRLLAHIRYKQANSPLWHAALYNCNMWTGEIAQFMGLKTPHHWLRPQEYVTGIKELNGGLARPPESWAAEKTAEGAPAAAYSSEGEDRYTVR
jgi:hypothetical protein